MELSGVLVALVLTLCSRDEGIQELVDELLDDHKKITKEVFVKMIDEEFKRSTPV